MPQPRRVGLPSASLTARKSARTKKKPVTEFEIRIYDQPHYVPGQTPPQPPISLVPPRDTDAFIIDKVVTPFYVPPEEERTVRRVLNYVVGWPDRPLERLLVPCTQVLDYVSPRELEDWEYALMLRQQREKDEAAAASLNTATRLATGDDELHHQQKKRRRVSPPGNSTPNGYSVLPAQHPRGPRRKRRGRPSKMATTMENTADASGTGAASADASAFASASTAAAPDPDAHRPPSANLLAQSLPPLVAGNQRTGLPLTLPVPLPLQQLAEKPDIESSNEGGEGVGPGLGLGAHAATASATDDGEDSDLDLADETGEEWPGPEDGRRLASTSSADTTSIDSQGEEEDQTLQQATALTPKAALWAPSSISDPIRLSQPQAFPHLHPHPPLPLPPAQPQPPRRVSHIPPPLIPVAKPQPKLTPILPPKIPGMPSPTASRSASNTSTDIGSLSSQKRKHEEVFTSTGSSSVWTPLPLPVGQDLGEGAAEESMAEAGGGEGEDLYEVDRLEDDFIATADEGTGHVEPVRFFLVRWKGDWPQDQNPTWEPADNLPPRMVRQYLKKAARRREGEPVDKGVRSKPDATRPFTLVD